MAFTFDPNMKVTPSPDVPYTPRAYGGTGSLGPKPSTSASVPFKTQPFNPASAGPLTRPTEIQQQATEQASKYSPQMLNYPEKLGSVDLLHYVKFYINIRAASKYINKYNTTDVPLRPGQTGRVDRTAVGKSLNDGLETLAVIGGAIIGARGGANAGRSVASFSKNPKAAAYGTIGGGTIGGLVGLAAGAFVGGRGTDAEQFQPDYTKRIDTVIQLAINDRPNVKYGVDYQSQDLGAAANMAQTNGSIADQVMNMNPELARTLLLNVAALPSAIASAFGGNVDIGAMANLGTGMTPNPFREQLFKAVDPRTFAFDYKFVPRSAEEAKAINDIIKAFKFHMHPEMSTNGYFLIYPSEFDIEYWYGDSENPNINRISTCVLENMSVDYGSNQAAFNSFADGMPTEINMRLQFRELEILTKDRIEQGGF